MVGKIVQTRIARTLKPKDRLALTQRTERDLIKAHSTREKGFGIRNTEYGILV